MPANADRGVEADEGADSGESADRDRSTDADREADTEDLPGPDHQSPETREAVETLLLRLADDEFVAAERYTEWQVRAPTLESDLAFSNIAQDELGHARIWYDLLAAYGRDELDLVWERPPGEWRHATLVELPFEEGDWADAVVRSYLYDVAEDLRLSALRESSFPRIRGRVQKVRGEEEYHREHARNWLDRLAADDEGRRRLQSAVDRLFPHAEALFAPVDPAVERRIDDLGLRTRSLADLHESWYDRVADHLASVGLSVPDPGDPTDATADAGDATPGRTAHTDHWPALYEEVTATYDELGREDVRELSTEEP